MNGASPQLDVAVVGAGISGLTCAFALRQRGIRAGLFEASAEPGGCIRTTRSGRYIADRGPQTFQLSDSVLALVKRLGLEKELVQLDRESVKPYLYHRGRLVQAPMALGAFLASPLLSVGAKLRVSREPSVGVRKDGKEESIAEFVERRAGREVVDSLIDPIVSGIFAGDPAKLSMASVFPSVLKMEREHGSILRALQARAAAAKTTQTAQTQPVAARAAVGGFRSGNDTLTIALARHIEPDVRYRSRVKAIHRRICDYEIIVEGEQQQKLAARSVVLACPAPDAANLLTETLPQAARTLALIEYVSVVQVVIAYPRAALGVKADGFGFLASRQAGLRILGAVWNSAVYPGRCPHDEFLVTAVLGGATDPQAVSESDDLLVRIAGNDLRRALKLSPASPRVVAVFRWRAAIPQYTVGHEQRIEKIEADLAALPQVKICSNYFRGISVPDCVKQANAVAEEISGVLQA